MKKILIIGANGFTGRRILDNLSENGACEVFGCSLHSDIRQEGNHTFIRLDINDYPAVETLFDHICPDVVINCSALSVPDYCELHREEAYAVNVSAVENLAHCCEHQRPSLYGRRYTRSAQLLWCDQVSRRAGDSKYLSQLCDCPCGCRIRESLAGPTWQYPATGQEPFGSRAGDSCRLRPIPYADLGGGHCRRSGEAGVFR